MPHASIRINVPLLSALVDSMPCVMVKKKRAPYGARPTGRVCSSLLAMFGYFNAALFAGALPAEDVVLTISRKRFARGYFAATSWRQADGKMIHEIALTPGAFANRSREATASTLVHEMVHCWQQFYGLPGKGAYHNAQWAKKMEELGLMPSSTGEPGGARRGVCVSHYVLEGGAFERAFKAMPEEIWLALVPLADEPERKERAVRRDGKLAWACGAGSACGGKRRSAFGVTSAASRSPG